MTEDFRRRIKKLEDAPTMPEQATYLDQMNPADREFFERMKSHRIAGGELTSDAERARYYDLFPF